MRTKQYHLTATQRLMVLIAIGLTAILITTYMTTTEQAVESTLPSNNVQSTVNTPNKPIIPMGNQVTAVKPVDQLTRDPFAKLPEPKEIKSQIDHGMSAVQSAVPAMVNQNAVSRVSVPRENLRLTGIVGNAERRLAVIMSANKSQSYGLNDMIGTYKIVTIRDDSVILTNSTGKLVLRLESAGQRGNNSSEK